MTNHEQETQMSNDTAWIKNIAPGYSVEAVHRIQRTLLEMMKEIDGIFRANEIHYFIAWGTVLGAVRHGGFIPWDDDLDICVPDEEYERAIALLRDGLPKTRVVHDNMIDDIYWCDFSKIRDVQSEVFAVEWPEDNALKYRGICLDIYRAKKTTKARFLMDHMRKQAQDNWKMVKLKQYPFWKKMIRLLLAYGYNITNTCLIILEPLLSGLGLNNYYRIIGPFYRRKDMFVDSTISPLQNMMFEDVLLQAPADAHRMLRALYGNYMAMPPIEKRKTHYGSVTFF